MARERALRTITPRDLGDFLVPALREPAWRREALCTDEEYFPSNGRPPQRLVETCQECPVRQECEEFALESPWRPYGIWGGKTSSELMPEWANRHEGASA